MKQTAEVWKDGIQNEFHSICPDRFEVDISLRETNRRVGYKLSIIDRILTNDRNHNSGDRINNGDRRFASIAATVTANYINREFSIPFERIGEPFFEGRSKLILTIDQYIDRF